MEIIYFSNSREQSASPISGDDSCTWTVTWLPNGKDSVIIFGWCYAGHGDKSYLNWRTSVPNSLGDREVEEDGSREGHWDCFTQEPTRGSTWRWLKQRFQWSQERLVDPVDHLLNK